MIIPAAVGTLDPACDGARRRAEEARRALAGEREAALGRLTAQFTHELRNALTGVRCYLELLATLDLPPEVAGYRAEVETGIDRMVALVTGWLDMARGKPSTAYLNGELHRLLGLLRATGLGRRMRLEEDLDPEAGMVAADPAVLESSLLVLLVELVEASPRALFAETRREGDSIHMKVVGEEVERPGERRLDVGLVACALGSPVRRIEGPETGFEVVFPLDREGDDGA